MFKISKNYLKCLVLPFSEFFEANRPGSSTAENAKETGLNGLRRMFEVDEFGNVSNEMTTVLQVACMSVFVGGVYGGIINSRLAYLEFMKNNEATAFRTHLEAKRKLQDAVTIAFGKGAFKWSTRLTFFSTSFVGTATMIQAYRGKSGISEYVAGGGISGFLYKFNMGPRGWIVGSGLGMFLGFICGCITKGILTLAGVSMDEAREYQNMLVKYRREYFRRGVKEYLEKDSAELKLRDEKFGKEGASLDNLDKDEEVKDSKK